MAAETLMES